MSYQKIIIYYFSGTGNAKNVASWIANQAIFQQMEVEFISIANPNRIHIPKPDSKALIAFVSPVHGFNYPPVMLHFILRFPKSKNKVLLINTRAGMLIGKFITPGLSGIALYLSALILLLKGYSIKALFPVDLPSNWISLHPALNNRTVQYLHEKNKAKVTAFAQRVFAGKSDFKSVRELIQDMLISPIAVLYYIVGRFMIAKTFYASKDCDNCGLCSKDCPVKAIVLVDNRPFWTFNCESCMHCMNNCPKRAIETAHGFIIGWLVVASTLVGIFLVWFKNAVFSLQNEFLEFLLNQGLILALLALGYYAVHYLLRFRFFERIMVYTSLTKFKWWGRYKALRENKKPLS